MAKSGEVSKGEKVGLFIAAWAVVLHIGAFIFITAQLLAVVWVGDRADSSSSAVWLVHSLIATTVLAILIAFISRYKKAYLIKSMESGLWVGVAVYAIILISSAIGVIATIEPRVSRDSNQLCSGLDKQLIDARSAILPIGTDLGRGTAFAIDEKGTYVTAYHVIEGASRVFKSLTTGEVPLTILAVEPAYDVALLSSNEPTPNYLKITTNYVQADEVYAYGYPSNAFTAGGPTLSTGIISRVLTTEELRLTEAAVPAGLEMIQSDVAVNPGNSGGPLFNECGVIGVVSSLSDSNQFGDYGFVSEQGISYSVSSKTLIEKFGLRFGLNDLINSQ